MRRGDPDGLSVRLGPCARCASRRIRGVENVDPAAGYEKRWRAWSSATRLVAVLVAVAWSAGTVAASVPGVGDQTTSRPAEHAGREPAVSSGPDFLDVPDAEQEAAFSYWLPPLSGEAGDFYGVAVYNPTDKSAQLVIDVLDGATGRSRSAAYRRTLGAGEQFAALASDLWDTFQDQDQSWVSVRSDVDGLVVFTQIGDYALTRLDGVSAFRRVSPRWFLLPLFAGPGALQGYDVVSRIHVINPTGKNYTVRLTVQAAEHSGTAIEVSRELTPGQMVVWNAAEVSGDSLLGGFAEVKTVQGEGVITFLETRIPDVSTWFMLPGMAPAEAGILYSPQWAYLENDLFSLLALANPRDDATTSLEATAVREDGSAAGKAVPISLGPGAYEHWKASDLFPSPAGAFAGWFVGSLRIRVLEGPTPVGAVLFAGEDLSYAAATPLQTELSSSALFGHVASIPGEYFTGLALLNPWDETSDVRISVFSHSGERIGGGDRQLGPQARISQVLPELTDVERQLGGAIRLESTRTLAAQLLFGTESLSLLSAVPAVRFPGTSSCRDARRWPFRQDSIWNTPLGEEAMLVPAELDVPGAMTLTADEDVLILEPNAPLKPVFKNTAGWDRNKTRCGAVTSQRLFPEDVPVPATFRTDPGYLGLTPNMSGAILMPDEVTVKQTQPLHVCDYGGTVTSQYLSPDTHLRDGDGIRGAHGGSGMSSIGGTLRLGELVPGGVIRHALKVNLWAHKYLHYDSQDATPGYRWPAVKADGYAADEYGGPLPALEMGALLALRSDFDSDQLRTEPARILAQALKNYGAYVVDDTAWDVFAIATEWSPEGRVIEEFESTWGWPFETGKTAGCSDASPECRWAKDIADILGALHVVDDNSPETVGGQGRRRAAWAPPFCEP